MRIVSCKELTPDMQLARNVYKHGCIFLKKGLRNIDKYQERLENLGVYYVYVTDNESVGIEVPDAVSEETREKCKSALQNTFEDFAKKQVMDIERISYPVNCLMKDIFENMDVQISMADISICDEYTFGHSVSTAVYASLIGMQFDLEPIRLKNLVMGALLHDIGKTMLNGAILYKQGALDAKEYEYITLHPGLGYEAVRSSKDIPDEAKLVILNHHERLNGIGYPNKLEGDKLDLFSRIVAVADVFDALTSTRCYRQMWELDRAASHLSQKAGIEYDADSVRYLLKRIAIYPNGRKVYLSNGCVGIVKAQNINLPHCPIVRVIEEKGKQVFPYEVDLSKERGISITAC